eukprot:1578389-Rhodomonas_salina.1
MAFGTIFSSWLTLIHRRVRYALASISNPAPLCAYAPCPAGTCSRGRTTADLHVRGTPQLTCTLGTCTDVYVSPSWRPPSPTDSPDPVPC